MTFKDSTELITCQMLYDTLDDNKCTLHNTYVCFILIANLNIDLIAHHEHVFYVCLNVSFEGCQLVMFSLPLFNGQTANVHIECEILNLK